MMNGQPVERIEEVGGIYFRSILLEAPGDRVPQHKHDHDHATLVASGAALAWSDGKFLGDFYAPAAIEIKAGAEHLFEALEPNTRLVCVHSVHNMAEA